jgi:hypothetical protein
MFSSAIVVSTVAHFPVKSAFWLAQPTMTMGAFSRKRLSIPFNSFLISESVTITKRYGCLFPAEGDCLPASTILSKMSWWYLLVFVASNASTAQNNIKQRHKTQHMIHTLLAISLLLFREGYKNRLMGVMQDLI